MKEDIDGNRHHSISSNGRETVWNAFRYAIFALKKDKKDMRQIVKEIDKVLTFSVYVAGRRMSCKKKS